MSWLSRYPAIAVITLAVLAPSAASTPAAAKSAGLVDLRESSCSAVVALSSEMAEMPSIPQGRVPIPSGSMAEGLLRELQGAWKELAEDRDVVRERIAEAGESCGESVDEAKVGPRLAPLERQVQRLNKRVRRLAVGVERWDALQNRVARFLGGNGGLPEGHPSIDDVEATPRRLPRWHPPTGKRHGVGGTSPRGLPPGHPPIQEDLGSRVNTDVIEI